MIDSFGTLYQGHIGMGGLGFDGTPANDRRFDNETLSGALHNASEFAQLLDELGFDVFWMAEHHFQHEGYECIPNILLLSVHLAAQTKRLRFGCGFNIAPMWHPLRLAEDFATADILTKGRVIFGVGRGYHTREVETFGVPMLDSDKNREIFEEQLEIIFKALNQESFSHKGKHYTIPPEVPYRGYTLSEITLVPRPVNPVETWQPLVSGNPRGIETMVRHGIKGVISATNESFADQLILLYQDTAAKQGQELEPGENIALGYRFYLAETKEKAMREARPYFEEHTKFAAPLGMLRYNQDQMRDVGSARGQAVAVRPTIENGVESRVWLCGPPEEFVAYLKEVEQKYPGIRHVLMSSAMGMPKDVYMDQLSIFANEVMPHFKNKE